MTGGKIIVNGTLTGAGNATITLIGPRDTTILNGNIVTAGNAIAINDRVILNGNAGLDTTGFGDTAGASINIAGPVNADAAASSRSLTITSGTTGGVQLASAVGTEQPLQNLTITSGAPLELPTITSIGSVNLDSGGGVTQTGPLTTSTLTVTAQGDVNLGSNNNVGGGGGGGAQITTPGTVTFKDVAQPPPVSNESPTAPSSSEGSTLGSLLSSILSSLGVGESEDTGSLLSSGVLPEDVVTGKSSSGEGKEGGEEDEEEDEDEDASKGGIIIP